VHSIDADQQNVLDLLPWAKAEQAASKRANRVVQTRSLLEKVIELFSQEGCDRQAGKNNKPTLTGGDRYVTPM
jgi:hypothetical protein